MFRSLRNLNAMAFMAIALCSINVVVAGSDAIDLRLSVARYDANASKVYVNVEVRYNEAGELSLGSQNYRFYYDSETLDLRSEETTQRLSNNYGQITFEESHKGLNVDEVNQLSFDDNLGFANFSIPLINNKEGGKVLSKQASWVSVATLVFDVLKTSASYEVVWGRDGVTDLYATAFVQVGAWRSQRVEETIAVNLFEDLSIAQSELDALGSKMKVSVGPNPTVDFVTVNLENSLLEDAQLIVTDYSGRVMMNQMMVAGATSSTIQLGNMTSGAYILQLRNDNGILMTERIAVTK
jgi:hypothetical protein